MTLKPNDFWYTPSVIWKAVDSLFGIGGYGDYGDPCPVNPNFDGLQHSWRSDCYINPPYSRKLRRAFIQKGIKEYKGGRYLWLLNFGNNVDHWDLHKRSSAVRIPETRIRFVPGHPELGDGQSPMYDSIFILWGDPAGFAEAFKGIGKCYANEYSGGKK